MKKLHIAALVLALAFGLSACGGEKVEAPNSAAPVETAAPTAPATPTASPEATASPTPTPTPSPSAEPSPEPTPEVTATPTPAPTPKASKAPVNTPAPTPTPQDTKNDDQSLNLSQNAPKVETKVVGEDQYNNPDWASEKYGTWDPSEVEEAGGEPLVLEPLTQEELQAGGFHKALEEISE